MLSKLTSWVIGVDHHGEQGKHIAMVEAEIEELLGHLNQQ